MSQYLTPTTAEEDELDRVVRETLSSRSAISWHQLIAAEADAIAVHGVLDRINRKIAVDLESRRTSLSALRAQRDAGQVSQTVFAEAHVKYSDWRSRTLYFRGHLRARLDELDDRMRDIKARHRADASHAEWQRYRDALYTVQRQHVPDASGDPRMCMRCHDAAGDPIEHPCPTHQAATDALTAPQAVAS
ncbi:hypothetical protein [Amycolatopsis sp. NPDC051128]|uniref:hypothetical protein n=1 Tax=Amycolatopsis sp. NPDC051128 TaxID=3155412 RepID=UPI003425FF67